MKPKVTIIDYGAGNLHSAANAFVHLGAEPELVERPEDIESASCLVLPGVGAFGEGMAGLHQRNLIEPLRAYARSGRPLLGICLGAQLLMEESEEFGKHEGLGIIPGTVRHLPSEGVKVPHIGWSRLDPVSGCQWQGTPLEETPPGTWVYFVHSLHCIPSAAEDMLAISQHGTHKLTAAVRRDRTVGLQFHPEKSGAPGLAMLRRFLENAQSPASPLI